MLVDKLVKHPKMSRLPGMLDNFVPYFKMSKKNRRFFIFRSRFSAFLRRFGRRILSRKSIKKFLFFFRYRLGSRFSIDMRKKSFSLLRGLRFLKKIVCLRRKLFFTKFSVLPSFRRREVVPFDFHYVTRPRYFRWNRKKKERLFFKNLREKRRQNKFFKPKIFRNRVHFRLKPMLFNIRKRLRKLRLSLSGQRSAFFSMHALEARLNFITYVYLYKLRRLDVGNEFLMTGYTYLRRRALVRHNQEQRILIYKAKSRRRFYKWKPFKVPRSVKFHRLYPAKRKYFLS